MVPPPQIVKHHPNATTAAGLGGVGLFVVWLLGFLHVSLSAEDATVISGSITSAGLFVGKRGVCGLARLIWKGDGGQVGGDVVLFVIAFILGVLVDRILG